MAVIIVVEVMMIMVVTMVMVMVAMLMVMAVVTMVHYLCRASAEFEHGEYSRHHRSRRG